MKKIKFLIIFVILTSVFVGIPVNVGAEGKKLDLPLEMGKRLRDGDDIRGFPIIGDRLNDELMKLSESVSLAKYLNHEITEEDYMRLVLNSDSYLLPWALEVSAVANQNDDMKILAPEYLAANKTTFTNNLGKTQIWKTPEFNHTVENSVSTTTTNSAGISATVNCSFKIPFIGDTGISVTATYNYSDAKAVTNKTTETWTIPSQDVSVEPGQTVRVEWLVTVGKATGTTNLDVRLNGQVPFMMDENGTRHGQNMKQTFRDYDRFTSLGLGVPPLTQRDLYTNRVGESVDRTFGKATYEAKHGLEMIMNVYEVKSANGIASKYDRLIKSKTFSADELRMK